MPRIQCFSNRAFGYEMRSRRWTDAVPDGSAAISITGTRHVKDAYGEGFEAADRHLFPDGARNVLNLDFDDIDRPSMDIGNGRVALGISPEQAAQVVEFIESHKDCDFYIHCHAGVSRSRAAAQFILDAYPGDWTMVGSNDARNMFVYRSLLNAYEEMHND